ncbi:MAG TPA: hypothetical protein VGB20_03715 [bacterium]
MIRCEDDTWPHEDLRGLLDGAKAPHLLQLSHAGAGGRLELDTDGPWVDRLALHCALLGLDPRAAESAPAAWYAAAADLQLAPDERAWCCELVTQRDGTFIDPSAGGITTKESQVLIQALDEQLGSDTRRWEVGDGPHHILVMKQTAIPAGPEPQIAAPAVMTGQRWKRRLPRGAIGRTLAALVEQAGRILEQHPVNRVRIDLGENPANLIWLWGGSASSGPPAGGRLRRHGASGASDPNPSVQGFRARTGHSGAVIAPRFPFRGLGRACGLTWQELPEGSTEPAYELLFRTIMQILDGHDLIYAVLSITHTDPIERLCAMERLDHAVLRPLTERLGAQEPWRLLVVPDNRMPGWVPFVAIGSGLPQQPVMGLTASAFEASPLSFRNGRALLDWFLQPSPAAQAAAGRPGSG